MLYIYNMSSKGDPDRVFKALANPTRRAVLDELSDGPRTTGYLCAAFEQLDRCTVMQHLRVLEDADLVVARRRGRERWNHLNAIPIQQIYDRWISRYAQGAVQQLTGLASALEAGSGNDARSQASG